MVLVEDSQCATRITEFGSHSVETALSVVQGIVTILSVIGSILLILSYVLLRSLRTKSRLLITHLALANFLQAFPNFLAVFMNFRTKFKMDESTVQSDGDLLLDYVNATNITEALACNGASKLLDHSSSVYCNVCVYQGFISLTGAVATIFWTVCVCIHYFILVSYQNTKLASQVAYIYYVIAWLAPLGICLWLLFHNWLGFEPTYSTVNCGIRTDCIPHHHPYQYESSEANNWNRVIGLLFGLKIWQVLAFLIIPCLFIAIQCKNKKHRIQYKLLSSAPVRDMERKLLLIPLIFMLISTVCFVSDLYFLINYKRNLGNLQKNNSSIIFVHFLIRIFDNSQGMINFCLFCLSAREVRRATFNDLKQLCQCRYTKRTTPVPEIRKFTVVTPTTGSIPRYGTVDPKNH